MTKQGCWEADLIFVIEGPQVENALTGRSIITAILVIISNNIIIMLFLLKTSNKPSDAGQQANYLGISFPCIHGERCGWSWLKPTKCQFFMGNTATRVGP